MKFPLWSVYLGLNKHRNFHDGLRCQTQCCHADTTKMLQLPPELRRGIWDERPEVARLLPNFSLPKMMQVILHHLQISKPHPVGMEWGKLSSHWLVCLQLCPAKALGLLSQQSNAELGRPAYHTSPAQVRLVLAGGALCGQLARLSTHLQ